MASKIIYAIGCRKKVTLWTFGDGYLESGADGHSESSKGELAGGISWDADDMDSIIKLVLFVFSTEISTPSL